MCESKVFLVKNGGRIKIMDAAIKVRDEGDKVVVVGLLGERKELENARITEINISEHEVLLAHRG